MEYCSNQSQHVIVPQVEHSDSLEETFVQGKETVHLTLGKLPFLTAQKTSQLSTYLHQVSGGQTPSVSFYNLHILTLALIYSLVENMPYFQNT